MISPIRLFLRAATAADHGRVDRAYARFDLSDRRAYGDFLVAHALALRPIERAIAAVAPWPDWRPRWPALAQDLDELGRAAPAHYATLPTPDVAGAWGMLYVVEGSRLGGALLARRVGPGLPRRYLAPEPDAASGWPAFQAALTAAAESGDDGWLDRATAGAKRAFRHFEDAAMPQMEVACG